MEDNKLKHIQLLFDSPPEEAIQLAQKLGEAELCFSDSAEKITAQNPGFLVRDDKQISWAEGVSGLIHPKHLNHPVLEYLIKRAQNRDFSVDMSESYQEFDKTVYSYRFIDPFEEGEIGDQLAHLIFREGFDPLPFKSFHTAMMGYVAHHVRRRNMMLPIDVQLGLFQGCFVVQVMVSAHLFVREHLIESFGPSDVNHPYHSFLRTCFDNTHIFDIATIKAPEKIIFTGVWCHDQYKLPGGTLLCHSVAALKSLIKTTQAPVFPPEKSEVHFHDLHLSGDKPKCFERKNGFTPDHPHLTNIVIEHCHKKLREQGKNDDGDVIKLVSDFADAHLLEKLNDRDWKLVEEAIADTSVRELLQNEVESVIENVDSDVFEKASRMFSRMSLNEAVTLVSGKIKEDEFKQIVTGKISAEDKSVTIVTGRNFEHDPNEIWEIKKQNVLSKTQEKWLAIKDKNISQEELVHELCRIVKEEVGLEDSIATQIVKGPMDAALDEVASERLRRQREQIRQENQDKFFKSEIAKRDKQIRRMKGILDNIKAVKSNRPIEMAPEMLDLLDDGGQNDQVNYQNVINGLNAEVESLKRQLKEREILHERDADSRSRLLEDLEKKMNYYRERTEEDKNFEKEILSLNRENERLKSQNKLGDTRVEHMSERIEQERSRSQEREAKKIAIVERKVTLLEVEKQKYLERISALEQENQFLKDSRNSRMGEINSQPEAKGNDEKHEELIKTIEEFKNKERESERVIKEQHLKLRQLEQKLKFATAQLEKGLSRQNARSTSNGTSANEQRLEKINEKLKQDVSAQLQDLNERKKEAVKLRIKNNQLQNRINELERLLQKKAS